MDQQLTAKDQKKIFICLVLYITALVASNTIGIKTMPFLFGTHLSVSVFYFPFVFLMTDIIGEVYGKKMAKMFVLAGFVSVVAFLLFNIISMLMPWAEASMWAHDAYNTLYSVSIRISIASILAFVIGEYQDVMVFFFFKAKQGGKYFWLRSNLSNIWSQFLDTVIFMLVAFVGVYSFPKLILMIIPWWIYKVLIGFAYTPISYLGIKLLRGNNESQTS
ncbi:MAG: queuosine precursor transporter [Candidatus Pacebacteria bacterium]|nr:queuosine precursor transporter [Candidatus Paceibacterota bacterium]